MTLAQLSTTLMIGPRTRPVEEGKTELVEIPVYVRVNGKLHVVTELTRFADALILETGEKR